MSGYTYCPEMASTGNKKGYKNRTLGIQELINLSYSIVIHGLSENAK
jgi:hypothetical protein